MPDTLYTKINLLSSKVDSLSEKVTHVTDKSSALIWIPIIAALITAVIGTLLSQAIDRLYQKGAERKRESREAKSPTGASVLPQAGHLLPFNSAGLYPGSLFHRP